MRVTMEELREHARALAPLYCGYVSGLLLEISEHHTPRGAWAWSVYLLGLIVMFVGGMLARLIWTGELRPER